MKNVHRFFFSIPLMVATLLFGTALFKAPVQGTSHMKDYDAPLAVDDDNNVYVLDNYGENDNQELRILRISPYNQSEEVYRVPADRFSDSYEQTKLGNMMRSYASPATIDDMWWADDQLYFESGGDVFAVPKDNNHHLEKMSHSHWHDRKAEEDTLRENDYIVQYDPNEEDALIVDRRSNRDEDWQYDADTTYSYSQHKPGARYVMAHDTAADKERDLRVNRLESVLDDRRREIDELRSTMRRSVTNFSASVSGFSRNTQSQSAFTEGSSFSDQQQSQDSNMEYEFNFGSE